MESMGSIWPRTGWAGGRAKPSLRWSMRRTSAKLWRSIASTWVLAMLKVCHVPVTVAVWTLYKQSYIVSIFSSAVFEVTNRDAESILKKAIPPPSDDGVVRLRGLPFISTEADIAEFFSGSPRPKYTKTSSQLIKMFSIACMSGANSQA